MLLPAFQTIQIHYQRYMGIAPAEIYLFKLNKDNTGLVCDICPKLTIKTQKWRHWRCSAVFIDKLEKILQIVLVFPLLNLNK